MNSRQSKATGKSTAVAFQQIQDGELVEIIVNGEALRDVTTHRISADELLISPSNENPVETANVRTVFPLKSFKGHKFKPGMHVTIKTKDGQTYPAEVALILKDGLYIRPPGSKKKPGLVDLFRLWALKK